MRFLMLSLAMLAAASPVAAQTTPAAKPDARDPNAVVCHVEPVTGSYAKRIKRCMTRARWIKESEDAQRDVENTQLRGAINSCSNPDRTKC